jgi:hypothetical protein
MVGKELHLRLFFEDDPVAWPSVTGWSETGVMKYSSGALGSGMSLPSSASLLVPVEGVDYLDITVMGDGRAIRGAFISSATRLEVSATVDLVNGNDFKDPFGKLPEAHPQTDDSYLFGRVRAALLAEATKLPADAPVLIDFQLDRDPLLAVISFEVLNADVASPPYVSMNGTQLGEATPQLPDLADPAYRGEVAPQRADMQFRYAGWLHCEKIIPASALRTGVNQLSLGLRRGSRVVAVRAVEIQLKYDWEGVDALPSR